MVLWLARRFLLAFEHSTTPLSTRKTPYFLSFHTLAHTWFLHFPHLLSFQSLPHTRAQITRGYTLCPDPGSASQSPHLCELRVLRARHSLHFPSLRKPDRPKRYRLRDLKAH